MGCSVSSLDHEVVAMDDLVAAMREGLPADIARIVDKAESTTAHNDKFILQVAFNYGGRADIVDAAQRLADRGEPITQESMSAATALAHVGDPDLLIRTGGERRISNFLLWQSSYAEMAFLDTLWPDFRRTHLWDAIVAYSGRDRRFGGAIDAPLSR